MQDAHDRVRRHESSAVDAQMQATRLAAEVDVADSKQQRREAESTELQVPCKHCLSTCQCGSRKIKQ